MTTPMDSNLVGGPAPTYLPDDPEPRRALEGGARAYAVVRSYPTSSLLWADLADEAYTEGRIVESYAYARAGYHRGLDALRRAGWRGRGPVPWEHEPNRGFLRSLHGLARAAAAIGEDDEATRCTLFLRDSSAAAAAALENDGLRWVRRRLRSGSRRARSAVRTGRGGR